MRIYAYYDERSPDHLKIGETAGCVKKRVAQQKTGMSHDPVIVLDTESGATPDGRTITDTMVHEELRRRGISRVNREWYECSVDDVRDALITLQTGAPTDRGRNQTFGMRPEQERAVEMTAAYFTRAKGSAPRFLWNAKMRFGKTFSSYQLARRMGWTRVLVLTYKPAVEDSWANDLRRHTDFSGWRFVANGEGVADPADPSPLVWFTSIQSLQGRDAQGMMRERFDALVRTEWDLVIVDEYHFGAWRDAARSLYEGIEEVADADDASPEDIPVRGKHYLYLSGTPFRALTSGEFSDDQVFNWTYQDEQRAKESWRGEDNPYAPLPRMNVYTYHLPDEMREVARREDAEFSLNEFFRAERDGDCFRFVHEEEVQAWLDMQRGAKARTISMRLGRSRFPFSDPTLLDALNHTLWYLPSVPACEAMRLMLEAPRNRPAWTHKVIVAAGNKAGMGAKALEPVRNAIGPDPRLTKTITLSCGKLMTGVSVPEWGGILMLRGIESPEGYFQSAFRVQTHHVQRTPEGVMRVLKPECYVFDYDPNRALRLMADYQVRLGGERDAGRRTAEEGLAEFLRFMPVICYEGGEMHEVDAAELLDIAVSGIGATMLAQRWQSALMINADAFTLDRLLGREDVMSALSRIEAFRNLNNDARKIISSDNAVKKAKKDGRKLSPEEHKNKKESDKLRGEVVEKLLKFVTRIPVFMYLTDAREESLVDVIRNIEPTLFTQVTGITVKDFDALCEIGVFDRGMMNKAILSFRQFEEPSLQYAGGGAVSERVGLWSSSVSREEARALSDI